MSASAVFHRRQLKKTEKGKRLKWLHRKILNVKKLTNIETKQGSFPIEVLVSFHWEVFIEAYFPLPGRSFRSSKQGLVHCFLGPI